MTETIKVSAICVSIIDYHDYDNLITLCALGKGKIFAQVKGSKKPKSKLRFCTSPMCFAEYILTVTKSNRYLVTGCNLIDNFYDIRNDVLSFYSASVMMEILDKITKETENDQIIIETIKILKNICYNNIEPEISLMQFLKFAIELSGYEIPKIKCAKCNAKENLFLDFSSFDFRCINHKTASGIIVPKDVQNAINLLVENDFENLKAINKKTILNGIFLLEKYFSLITDTKIKSFNSFIEMEQDFINY